MWFELSHSGVERVVEEEGESYSMAVLELRGVLRF